MKRSRSEERYTSRSEAAALPETALPHIFTVAIDYSVDDTGKPIIYEIQPFSTSMPSELAELSLRKAHKKRLQALRSMGVDSDYMEFDLSDFEKLEQRRLMSKCGLQEYQPNFTHFHSKDTDKEAIKKTLLDFMKARPETKMFVLKKNSASRGGGNIFFAREDLETLLETDPSHELKAIYDLELESADIGFDLRTNSPCIETFTAKIDELEDYFLLEEVINPQSTSAAPKTFRCFVAYNPYNKSFAFQPARTYYHKPESQNSHSYLAGGSEDDFIDESHFKFNQDLATEITDLATPEKSPEEIAKEKVTRDAIEKIITTIFDLSNLPHHHQKTQKFEIDSYKKSKTARINPLASEAATTFLTIINNAEYSAQVAEPLSKRKNIEADLIECCADLGRATTKADVVSQNIKILQKYLPFFEIAEVRNLFSSPSNKNDKIYRIKKSLGLILIGNLDKNIESEADYTAYKKAFDRFLVMPLNPEHIAAYLKEPKPLFTAKMPEDLAKSLAEEPTTKPLPLLSRSVITASNSMTKY